MVWHAKAFMRVFVKVIVLTTTPRIDVKRQYSVNKRLCGEDNRLREDHIGIWHVISIWYTTFRHGLHGKKWTTCCTVVSSVTQDTPPLNMAQLIKKNFEHKPFRYVGPYRKNISSVSPSETELRKNIFQPKRLNGKYSLLIPASAKLEWSYKLEIVFLI